MATWIAHMRVAEKILGRASLHTQAFLAGNIAPDCGMPNEDWSQFDPPKTVTHWLSDDPDWIKQHGYKINPDRFFETYLKENSYDFSDDRKAFLLGYYCHLLTDVAWIKMDIEKLKENPNYQLRRKEEPEFIWEVKKDWYGLDFNYIKNNEGNIFETVFEHINQTKDYLCEFPQGAFNKQFDYIKKFYRTEADDYIPTDRYLTEVEMNRFVETTAQEIQELFEMQFAF